MTNPLHQRCWRAFIAVPLVCCFVWSSPALAQDECTPAALIDGEPDLVIPILEMLKQRGISLDPPTTCEATVAHISHHDGHIMVSLETSGDPETRLVSDTVTAATVIESWARGVLANPLLEPAVPPTAQPTVVETPALVAQPPPIPQTTQLRFGIGGGFFVARGSESSTWFEPMLDACVAIADHWCVGAEIRGRLDTQMSGESTRLDTSRVGVDVLLTADYVLLDTPMIVIGPSVGAGWLRSRYTGEEAQGDPIDVDGGGPRVGIHADWIIPADGQLSLLVGANVNYSPLSPSQPHKEGNLEIAADTRWMFSLGVGIHYGTP